ncbi:MAG: hypothetical protein OEN01_15450, partial [Candidatus Krumholzibacteria bacterium]|nr:hypothetical protein [Candidatus Krumholzibacteria bacterium]
MRHNLSLGFASVSVGVVLLGLLWSCARDDPTVSAPRGVDQSNEGRIDPSAQTDFFIGSASIDGTPERQIEVWGHNLIVESGSVVSFDVVLVNQSNEVVYPLVLFYITATIPSSVRVLNHDGNGFESSWVFDFSDNLGDDNRLDPGEHSDPVRMRFGLPELASFAIGFRVTVGVPPVMEGCVASYPTIYTRLAPETLAALRTEFERLNPNVCSGLNEYGFTTGVCRAADRLPDDVDIAALISTAKTTLVENARFTGVREPSSLVATSHNLFSGDFRVDFARQLYERLQVVGTNIRVHLDTGGVRAIHGNHYPEICVPPQPLVTSTQAQESVIGVQITWYDFGGYPRVYTVTEDDLQEQPIRIILPLERHGVTELRVAWRVPI